MMILSYLILNNLFQTGTLKVVFEILPGSLVYWEEIL